MRPTPEHALTTSYFALLFDLSRGKQALLSVAQPALGAILALGAMPSLNVLIIGLLASTAGFLAVFSLNDVLDYKVDRKALQVGKAEVGVHDIDVTFLRHPLARGDLSYIVSLIWVISLALFAGVLAYLLNPLCLWLFIGCIGLEVAYCLLRSVSWLKTFVSGVMVGVGGLAGWAAVAPLTELAIYYFLLLALWEIAGRNLANDLADIEADSKVGIKTVATVFGNRVSAGAVFIGAWVTVVLAVALPMPIAPKLLAIGAGLWSMGLPAIGLARVPSSVQATLYFNRASLFPALVFVIVLASLLFEGI